MHRVIGDKVRVDAALQRDPEKPVALLKPEEMENAYVVVNGQEVRLARIPAAFTAQAVRELRAANRAVTQQAIAHTWVLNRDTWGRTHPHALRNDVSPHWNYDRVRQAAQDVAVGVPLITMGGMPTVAVHGALTEWARDPENRETSAARAIRALLTAEGLTDKEKEENARRLLGDRWVEVQNYLKANRIKLGDYVPEIKSTDDD
jgi:hypothetical protein